MNAFYLLLFLLFLLWFVRTKRPNTRGFLPFTSPCPYCASEPSATGIATAAFLFGTTPVQFKRRHGTLCSQHIAELVGEPSDHEHFEEAYNRAIAYVAQAYEERCDQVVSHRIGGPEGITETVYSSGRRVRHDPPLPHSEEQPLSNEELEEIFGPPGQRDD